jgi:hypothetical protein
MHGGTLRDFDAVRRAQIEPLYCLAEEERNEG